MSFSAAQDLKEQVRSASDIVTILGSYLELIPQGRDFLALCPFHDDTRPSLRVNPERQTWKCWPCDAGGDVFSFVMRRENVEFPAALRILAERAGIEVRRSGADLEPGSPQDKATLYKAMAWAEQQFHRFLLEASEAAPAREYLLQRHIDQDSIERFRIGFAPNQWQWLINRADSTPYSAPVLEAIGLVIRKENGRCYDRFRGRVMFPIRDTQDRPIAVGGRILPDFADENSPKYINSPETRLYTKSEQLFGLNLCRDALEQCRRRNEIRNVLVMEGYTDVIIAKQTGIETPVAVCGTSLGPRHVNLLRRYADTVTLVLDGDEAGQKRAAEVLALFVAGQIDLRIVALPDGLDPCDFILTQGPARLLQLVEESPDALDYCIAKETQGLDLANDTQRANESLERILATMARAPRVQEDTESAFRLREQRTLSRIARIFRVDEWLVRQQINALRASGKHTHRIATGKEVSEKPVRELLDGWERELFTLLIQNPDAVSAVVEKVSPTDMRTQLGRTLLVTYQELEATGGVITYQGLLDATEDSRLKNILVELGEAADRKQADDVDQQLHDLLAAYSSRRIEKERRKQLAELESGNLKEQEELELLNKLFESKKLDL